MPTVLLANGERFAAERTERDSDSRLFAYNGARLVRVFTPDEWLSVSETEIAAMADLVVRDAKLSRARPFQFLWDQRVLMGYLNLLIGEEGIGKGNLVAWIAARVTTGKLEGNLAGKPRRVVVVGDEDSWDHIWVPRLEAAGADLSLCQQFVGTEDGGALDVHRDASAIEDYIKEEGVALTYFDQLLDNLGATDTWKDKQIRDALAPIRAVAQSTQSALLCSMHPNKRAGTFRDKISGSAAFNALSRSSLLVAAHPDHPNRTAVVRAKGNYTVEPLAFEFEIEGVDLTIKERVKNKGKRVTRTHHVSTSRIHNISTSHLRADDLLEQRHRREQPESNAAQCREALKQLFAVKPTTMKVADVVAQVGFPETTVSAAAKKIGLLKWREGFGADGAWIWSNVPRVRVKRGTGTKRKAETPKGSA
jgi:hypothetical protein